MKYVEANRSERPSPRRSYAEGGSRQSACLPIAEQLSAPERAESNLRISPIVPVVTDIQFPATADTF
jgi:hypothetical protein